MFRQHHRWVIIPQAKMRAVVVVLAGHGADVPIVARDVGEALSAKLVQIAIFGYQFDVHCTDFEFMCAGMSAWISGH
jgi:hypothetical protein